MVKVSCTCKLWTNLCPPTRDALDQFLRKSKYKIGHSTTVGLLLYVLAGPHKA